MSETPVSPIFSAPETPEQLTSSVSVWSRMANVIASPSDAFDGITAIEKKSTLWLMPMIVTIIVTAAFAGMMMNNPAMQQKIRQSMIERMDEQVHAGKMTQDQVDKTIDTMMGAGKIMGVVGGMIAVPVMWLLIATVFYMAMAFIFGAEVTFMNVIVVVALASVISLLETVVTGLMQYATADIMAQPSLGILVQQKDSPYLFALLSRVNPFSFWWIFVTGIGFAKISGLATNKTITIVGTAWLIWGAVLVGLAGLGTMFKM